MNTQYSAPEIIGLSFEEAKAAMPEGTRLRAKIIDGKSMIVTQELRSERLNVALTDNKVSALLGWG